MLGIMNTLINTTTRIGPTGDDRLEAELRKIRLRQQDDALRRADRERRRHLKAGL